MFRLNEKHRKYIILAVAALAVGLVYVSYHLYLYKWYGASSEPYLAVAPMINDGYPSIFWPRLRALYDGYARISDSSLFEYRHGITTLHPLLNPFLYYPLLLIGGFYGVEALATFVFAAASFLLLFGLGYQLTKRFALSLTFAGIFVMIRDLGFLFFPRSLIGLKDLAKVFLPYTPAHSTISRLNFLGMEAVKPGLIIFGPFLIFLVLFLKTNKWRYAWLLGLFYGLLFYTYTFYWIYASICLGLLVLLYIILRIRQALLAALLAFGIGSVISIYFWMTQYATRRLPQYFDFIQRAGALERGHQFRISQWFWYLIITAALGLIYRFAVKRQRLFVFYFFAVTLIGVVVGLNIQIVTGMNIQPDHWLLRILFIPLAFVFLILADWLVELAEEHHRWRRLSMALAVILMLSVWSGSAHAAYLLAKERFSAFHSPVGIVPSLNWLNTHLPKDSVVATPSPYMNDLLLFYTSAKVMIPRASGTMAKSSEILDRLYAVYKLFGITEATFKQKINPLFDPSANPTEMNLFDYLYAGNFFSQEFDAFFRDKGKQNIPPDFTEKLSAAYRVYNFEPSILGKKYRIDYVYVGPLEKKIMTVDFARMRGWQNVYNQEGVSVYKINP